LGGGNLGWIENTPCLACLATNIRGNCDHHHPNFTIGIKKSFCRAIYCAQGHSTNPLWLPTSDILSTRSRRQNQKKNKRKIKAIEKEMKSGKFQIRDGY
jgi:hypothetical protein